MQKFNTILCIGNNTEDTDIRCRLVASNYSTEFKGFTKRLVTENGCYHTSFYDMEYGDLEELANSVDLVILLDQPLDTYPDEHGFHESLALVKSLTGDTIIENEELAKPLVSDLVKTNKSFCIYPFIYKMAFDDRLPCCYSVGHENSRNKNFPELSTLREQMLRGEKNHDVCSYCYEQEELGYASERINDTKDLALRYKIYTLEDLKEATEKYPLMYSTEVGNTCNLMCRTCDPHVSSMIEQENQIIKLYKFNPDYRARNGLDKVDITTARYVYISGGEPLAVEDTYKFLEKLISNDRTDVELHFNTNATMFTERFKKLIKQFTDVKFSVSIDALAEKNTYIRWPASWSKIVKNLRYLVDNGYTVMINTTICVYNISDLYELYKWLEQFKGIILNPADAKPRDGILSAFIRPDKEVVLDDLRKITTLSSYKNEKYFQNLIDGYIRYFESDYTVDIDRLKRFFDYNDRLDDARGSRLKDYLPKLEQCQRNITKQI